MENYAKIPIVEQSLGCVVLVNGRVDLERGFVRVEIMMGTMKNRAEVSTNKLKSVHTEKAEKLQQDMQNIKSTLPLVSIVFITFPSLSRTYNVLVKSAVLVNRHHLVLSRYI